MEVRDFFGQLVGDLESQGWLEMKKIGQKPTKNPQKTEKKPKIGVHFLFKGVHHAKRGAIDSPAHGESIGEGCTSRFVLCEKL